MGWFVGVESEVRAPEFVLRKGGRLKDGIIRKYHDKK